MSARSGTRLDGRYLLGDRIAVGGMGEVWRGSDQVLGRTVAVKILRAELAEDQAFRKRFRAEARTAGGLPHNGIAQVFDYGETTVGPDGVSPSSAPVQGDGIAYLVMELVGGEPLSAILQRDGALGTERTLSYVAQAAHALHAAHLRGVIHRDVKPANLMVTPEGRVKVTDFGIARPLDHEPLTMTGQVMGTAHYLAPELARGLEASPLSDVYALGVVAYECLAGHRPFEGENQVLVATAHLNQQPPPLPGTVPPDVIRVVAAAMEKEPEARVSSAEAFAVALDKLAAGDPSALDDIGGSGSGIRAAQAPTFGPDGALLGGAAARTGRHSSTPQPGPGPAPGPGSAATTRLTGPPADQRTRWTSPQTPPQGYPAAQSGYGTAGYGTAGYGTAGYGADDHGGSPGGPGRFGPGYSFGPTPSERPRERSLFSPTLILMLSLLALIIVLIYVLNRTGITGGLVELGDDPSPSPTQSVSQAGVAPSASSAITSRASVPATRATTSGPTRSTSTSTRASSATSATSSTASTTTTPPTSSTTTTGTTTTSTTNTTTTTDPSVPSSPPSVVPSAPVSVSPSLGLPGLLVVGSRRRRRRRSRRTGASGTTSRGVGGTWWTMAVSNEQGRNA